MKVCSSVRSRDNSSSRDGVLKERRQVMPSHLNPEQITEAMHRAADAAREHTRNPDRIAEFPLAPDDCEPTEDGWWHIGWVGVIGEPEEWDVLYDPVADQGRLRAKR
jgi:hypothetical protein